MPVVRLDLFVDCFGLVWQKVNSERLAPFIGATTAGLLLDGLIGHG